MFLSHREPLKVGRRAPCGSFLWSVSDTCLLPSFFITLMDKLYCSAGFNFAGEFFNQVTSLQRKCYMRNGLKTLNSARDWAWSCRVALKGPWRLGVQPGTEGCLASVRPSPLFSKLGLSVPQSLAGLAGGFRVWRDILPLAPVPGSLALHGPVMSSCREQKVKLLEAKWDQRSWPFCHCSSFTMLLVC